MKNPLAPLARMYRPSTPLEEATRELFEAEHALLKAYTGREWAEASVAYNTARIERLRAYIKETS